MTDYNLLQEKTYRKKTPILAVSSRFLFALEAFSIIFIGSNFLEQNIFGRLVFFLAILAIPQIISGFPLGNAMVHFWFQLESSKPNIDVDYSYSIFLVKTFIFITLFVLVNLAISILGISSVSMDISTIILLFIYGLGYSLLEHIRFISQILMEFQGSVLMDAFFLFSIWVVYLLNTTQIMGFQHDISSYLVLLISLSFFSAIIGALYYRSILFKKPKIKLNSTFFTKKFRSYTLVIALSSVFGLIFNQIDVYLLAVFISEEALAIFGVSLIFYRIYATIFDGVSMITFPNISREFYKHEKIPAIKYLQINALLNLTLSVPYTIFLLLFSDTFILLFFGVDYFLAGFLLKTLALAGLGRSFSTAIGIVFSATGHPLILSILTGISAITAIIFSLSMISIFGLSGAAISILLNQLLSITIAVLVFKRTYSIRFLEFLKIDANTIKIGKVLIGYERSNY